MTDDESDAMNRDMTDTPDTWETIVRELAAIVPTAPVYNLLCIYCWRYSYHPETSHDESCLWARARKLTGLSVEPIQKKSAK